MEPHIKTVLYLIKLFFTVFDKGRSLLLPLPKHKEIWVNSESVYMNTGVEQLSKQMVDGGIKLLTLEWKVIEKQREEGQNEPCGTGHHLNSCLV